jgi:hypothetical protein
MGVVTLHQGSITNSLLTLEAAVPLLFEEGARGW